MTRNNTADDDGGKVSRRAVLRGAGAAAGLVGLGAGANPASATSACPRTRHYWAESEWPPHVTKHIDDPFVMGGVSKSIAAWRLFLREDFRNDRAAMMAQQLLAARLNLLLRLDPDPSCVNRELSEYDGRTVEGTRNEATTWLLYSEFGQGTQRCWSVEANDDTIDGWPLYEILTRFNHGDFDELDCDCYAGLHDEHDLPPLERVDGLGCDGQSPDRVGRRGSWLAAQFEGRELDWPVSPGW